MTRSIDRQRLDLASDEAHAVLATRIKQDSHGPHDINRALFGQEVTAPERPGRDTRTEPGKIGFIQRARRNAPRCEPSTVPG
jgi:hypothetical protein